MKTLQKVLLLGSFIYVSSTAHAGLIQISNPDASYVAATTNIAITQPDGTDITSLSDGVLTIDFSHVREVHTVPSGGWSTWSSPPDSETDAPRVLTADNYNSSLSSLTLTFSNPVNIFGVEAEGDPFDIRTFTASFFNGINLVGSFTRDINGAAGARLLAASASGGDIFTSVTISTNVDFALAQFRYSLASASIPEPGSLALLSIGIATVGFLRRRRTAQ